MCKNCRTWQRLHGLRKYVAEASLHGLRKYVAEASLLQQIQRFLQANNTCQVLKGKLAGLGLNWL